MVSLFIANNIEKGFRLRASPEQRFLPGYLTRLDRAARGDGGGGNLFSSERDELTPTMSHNQALKTFRPLFGEHLVGAIFKTRWNILDH